MKSMMESARKDDRRETARGTRLLRGYLHKTSNSLCGIKGYASLIARQGAGDGDQAAWAAKIIREVERMETIFRTVGDMTQPVADAAPAVGLADVLTVAVAEAQAAYPDLEIDLRAVPEVPTLLPAADLRLALHELLANCAEGCRGDDGATRVLITVAAEPTGRHVLRVEDDGPGMGPELQSHATDPFVTTKRDRPGVGLTRVETLLDMYGLAWHLHSEPGVGTCVTCEVAGESEWNPEEHRRGRKAD